MKKATFTLCLIFVFLFAVVGGTYAAETLRLITWSGYTPKVLLDKFEKETGIKVMPTNSSNEEMIAKLRATRGAGFDLAQPSQDRISSVQAKFNIYQPIDLSKINTAQFVPSMLEAVKKNTMVNGKPHAVPFAWGSSGLVVNRKLAPDVQDYTDLLDKKYAGRISYRLKRPTLIALAFAMGDDPFAKYADANAYEALMEKVGQALIDAKPLVKNYGRKRFIWPWPGIKAAGKCMLKSQKLTFLHLKAGHWGGLTLLRFLPNPKMLRAHTNGSILSCVRKTLPNLPIRIQPQIVPKTRTNS
jgi:spermidine/putrescine transport system substrate-binding protein